MEWKAILQDKVSSPPRRKEVTILIDTDIKLVKYLPVTTSNQLLDAVRCGSVSKLKELLSSGEDPFIVCASNLTILHCACMYNFEAEDDPTALKMVQVILAKLKGSFTVDSWRLDEVLNAQEVFHGDTALHLAAKYKQTRIVTLLLLAGADFNLRNKKKQEAIQLIYENCHSALLPFFERMVSFDKKITADWNLSYDLKLLMGQSHLDSGLTNYAAVKYRPELNILYHCLFQSEKKKNDIFLHPVVRSLMYMKRVKVQPLLWILMLYHIVWLLLYAVFVVHVYIICCPMGDGTSRCILGQHTIATVEAVFVLCLIFSLIVWEILEICAFRTLYFRQWFSLAKVILVGAATATFLPVILIDEKDVIVIAMWQYQTAAFGILLACFVILRQIGRVPHKYDIYIEILGIVLKRTLLFSITALLLIFSFLIAIQILMPKKVQFHLPSGFIQLLVMMTGELSYDQVFYGDDVNQMVMFPTAAKIVYAIFVLIVAIVFFNVLIAFTVSDVKNLLAPTYLRTRSGQYQNIYLIENFFLSWNCFPGKMLKNWQRNFMLTLQKTEWSWIVNSKVSVDIRGTFQKNQEKLKDIARRNSLTYTTKKPEVSEILGLRHSLDEVKKKVETLYEILT